MDNVYWCVADFPASHVHIINAVVRSWCRRLLPLHCSKVTLSRLAGIYSGCRRDGVRTRYRLFYDSRLERGVYDMPLSECHLRNIRLLFNLVLYLESRL